MTDDHPTTITPPARTRTTSRTHTNTATCKFNRPDRAERLRQRAHEQPRRRGKTEAKSLVGGYHVAFLAAAGFTLTALIIGVGLLKGTPSAGAKQQTMASSE
ncbi:hypothetical protein ACFY3N_34755 [Streptomyces sp. NPDC000348]|uniref:hypothetical protein n=1 Tax=Streptomyces sp. NPDC000348 TaxID=3364538 RepID=UPI0036949B22